MPYTDLYRRIEGSLPNDCSWPRNRHSTFDLSGNPTGPPTTAICSAPWLPTCLAISCVFLISFFHDALRGGD